MPKRIRTFIAVEVSPRVRRQIVELQEALESSVHDIKWVEPEHIHQTLKFLGDVAETDLYEVCKTVQEVAATTAPFEMAVASVGAFPNPQRPRVIWVGVTQGSKELIGLQSNLEKSFRAQGYPREERAYTPHFTLGRIRRTAPNSDLEASLKQFTNWQGGHCDVTEVLVMASELGSGGPHYTLMGRGRLAGNSDSEK